MTKEIIKELDELGNVLYNKFGTDSYLERCTIHDLKTKIKALIIADVIVPKGTLFCENVIHHTCKHFDEIVGCDGCLYKKYQAK